MAMTHYSISDCAVYLVPQTTWGTAGLDATAGIRIPCEPAHFEFGDKEVKMDKALTVRTDDKQDYYTHQKGVTPTVTLKGYLVEDLMARLLYAHFQSVTEAAATPYGKTFVYHATQPDFTANAGHFFTLIMWNGVASLAYKISDCIIPHLNFSCEPGGMLKYTADIIGRKVVAVTANPAGTYSYLAEEYFHFEDQTRHTYNIGGGALTPVLIGGWELDLNTEIRNIGQDASGNVLNFGLGKRSGIFKSVALWDTTTRGLLTNRTTNTMVDCIIGFGGATAGATDGDLDFTFQGKVTPNTARNENLDLGVNVEIKLLSDIAASEKMITVVAADAVDMTW